MFGTLVITLIFTFTAVAGIIAGIRAGALTVKPATAQTGRTRAARRARLVSALSS